MTAQTHVQHTPGPWLTAPRGLHTKAPHTQIMAAGGWIADAVEYDEPWPAEANARLIAAAPDLLTALRHTVVQYQAFVYQCCKGEDNRWHERRIAEALEAIRKATGS